MIHIQFGSNFKHFAVIGPNLTNSLK